jgi:hypothetical protein
MKAILAGIALLSLLLGGATSAHAQSISGNFVDQGAGIEIDFPAGWSGILVQQRHPVVSPTGVGISGADVMMSVFMGDRLELRNLMFSEVDAMSAQAVRMGDDCESSVNEIVDLNGQNVFHNVHECDYNDGYSKTNSYIILTLTKAVVVSFTTTSESAYNRYVGDFERSVDTIKVNEPNDFRAGLELTQAINMNFDKTFKVESLDDEAKLAVISSSNVERASFDEDGMSVTVIVNEQKRTRGAVILGPSGILEGPYDVLIDGDPAEDFVEIDDRENHEKLVYVGFMEGRHEIEMFGTEVVPEFPVHLAGILAGVLSAAILAQRAMAGKKL